MEYSRKISSPSGRYEIDIVSREVFNTHWIELPRLLDKQTGETLFAFEDSHWSMDEAQWLGESLVRFTLRKYPGNHKPGELIATIDCAARTAKIGEVDAGSLQELEAGLDGALRWI
jgi:hypothetical protein